MAKSHAVAPQVLFGRIRNGSTSATRTGRATTGSCSTPADPRDFICAAAAKRRYLRKLSGPLLDRVDLRVQMHPVRTGALIADVGEATHVVRARVVQARATAAERWRQYGVRTNAEVPGPLLRQRFRLHHDAMAPLRAALDKGLLSIRGVDRAMRVAWTIADLAGRDRPCVDDVTTAMGFRQTGAER